VALKDPPSVEDAIAELDSGCASTIGAGTSIKPAKRSEKRPEGSCTGARRVFAGPARDFARRKLAWRTPPWVQEEMASAQSRTKLFAALKMINFAF
jgi:hypothetical protein